ncbi:MAG: hypothetical protein HY784_02880 [Chloroflexi bacterium]|nr:hypothetical protein [Chloroflexota bacterium]
MLDSAESLAPFAAAAPLEPADPANAWSIKLLLHDLDVALARRGEMIGALLLVGGPDLLPFHLLPNPTDDSDDEVPSDNPYATRDENYFVPEWPVGRLPAGKGNDPLLLLKQLRGVIAGQRVPGQVGKGARWLGGFPVWAKWLRALIQWFTRRRPPTGSGQRPPATGPAAPGESFGYAASVWKSASMAVFNTIGEPRALLTSPPVEASRLPGSGPGPGKLSYFNLHGIEDGPNWYGQREPGGPLSSQPEYPVALRPADVVNSGRAPQIVFSEACYGAHIAGKAVDEALSLKFLDAGARAVIGSTCVAYGSVATPLIGADLLGQAFWEYLARGLPAGEALRRARVSLARIMDRRQGYLDGEDQKTLISFVYFGDPLFRPGGLQPGPSKNPKTGVYRTRSLPAQTCLACDRRSAGRDNAPPDAQTLAQVKSIVARYLPGMQGATYAVTQPHTDCNGGDHLCPTAHLGAGSRGAKSAPAAHHRVITLSKVVQSSQHAHPRFARLTINAEGKVLKLAVSR